MNNSLGTLIAEVILKLKDAEQQVKKFGDDVQKRMDSKTFEIKNVRLSQSAMSSLSRQIADAVGGGGFGGGSNNGGIISTFLGRSTVNNVSFRPMAAASSAGSSPNASAFAHTVAGKPCPACGAVNPASATFCRSCGTSFSGSLLHRAAGALRGAIGGVGSMAGFGMSMAGTGMNATGFVSSGLWNLGNATATVGGTVGGTAFRGARGLARMTGLISTPEAPATLDDVVAGLQSVRNRIGRGHTRMGMGLGAVADSINNLQGGVGGGGGSPNFSPVISAIDSAASRIIAAMSNRGGGGGRPGRGGGGGGASSGDWNIGTSGPVLSPITARQFPLPQREQVLKQQMAAIDQSFRDAGIVPHPSNAGTASMQHLQQMSEEEQFVSDIMGTPSGMPDPARRGPSRRLRGGRRGGSTTLFSDIGGALAGGWRGLNRGIENGLIRGRSAMQAMFDPSNGIGQGNLGRLGVGLAIAQYGGAALQNYNQYNIAAAGAAGSGNVGGMIQANIAYQNNHPLAQIPVVGQLGAGIREWWTGDQKHIAKMQGEKQFQDETRYFRGDNANTRIGFQASAASAEGTVSGSIRSIDLQGQITRDSLKRSYMAQQERYEEAAHAKELAGDDSGAADLRRQGKLFAKDHDASVGALGGLERNQKDAIYRGDRSDATRSRYAVGANASAGVNNYQSERLGIEGGYQSQLDGMRMDDPRRSRIQAEMASSLGRHDRDYQFQTGQMQRGNVTSALFNGAARLGLSGNTIGATLGNIRGQQSASIDQFHSELRGVALDDPRHMAIVAAQANRMGALETQRKAAVKEHGLTLQGLDYDNQSAQRELTGDFLGSQISQINKSREQARATMPSGQFARQNRLFDVQERMATQGEENRKIGVRGSTGRVNTSTNALNLAADGKDLQAEIESVKGNTQLDMQSIYADDSLTAGEKNERIGAIKRNSEARLKGIKRKIAESERGGTATSLGGFINFAGASSRSVVKPEDMDEARKAAEDAAKGIDAGAAKAKDDVRKRATINEELKRKLEAEAKGDKGKDASDMGETGAKDLLAELKLIVAQLKEGIIIK